MIFFQFVIKNKKVLKSLNIKVKTYMFLFAQFKSKYLIKAKGLVI